MAGHSHVPPVKTLENALPGGIKCGSWCWGCWPWPGFWPGSPCMPDWDINWGCIGPVPKHKTYIQVLQNHLPLNAWHFVNFWKKFGKNINVFCIRLHVYLNYFNWQWNACFSPITKSTKFSNPQISSKPLSNVYCKSSFSFCKF